MVEHLRKKGFSDIVGALHNKHLLSNVHNYRQKYFDDMKRQLDARNYKAKDKLFRDKLLQHQIKTNYRNELDRIKCHLSMNSSRFPIETIENLRNKIRQFRELGKEIALEDALNEIEQSNERKVHKPTVSSDDAETTKTTKTVKTMKTVPMKTNVHRNRSKFRKKHLI